MADKLTLELRALSKGVGIVDGGGGVACLFDMDNVVLSNVFLSSARLFYQRYAKQTDFNVVSQLPNFKDFK